jgi:hypothetical protein
MKQLVEEIEVFTKQCHVMFHRDCIGGVMVSVLVTSVEDHWVVQVVVSGVMLTLPTAGGFTTTSSQSRDIAGNITCRRFLKYIKRSCTGRNVVPQGHSIQISSQPVFVRIP